MLVNILFASVIGIIQGLYIDFDLCIVLYFFAIALCVISKNLDKKLIFCWIFVMLIFNIYTKISINNFDNKYKEGAVNDTYKIISYKEETLAYDKYKAKNSSGDKFLIYLPKGEEIKKGRVISAKGDLVLPDTKRNSGGFDLRRYQNSQGIFGSVFVDKYEIIKLEEFNLIYYLQDMIYTSISSLLTKEESALVLGMMIGETKDISDEIMTSFEQTGITHLVAVSGSNVVYIMLFVTFVFQKLIGKRYTYFVSIGFALIFMLVAGGSASVVRATIMMIMTLIANIFYLKSDTISNISFSAMILLIISPLIIYDVGFILSFGGTLGIVAISKELKKKFLKFGVGIADTLSVTVSAQLILAPIMAYYFNTVSILSVFTNLIVVPFSGAITILGFITFILSKIFIPFAQILAYPLYCLSLFTIYIAKILSQIPFANIKVVTPNIFEIIVFYLAIFVFIKKINLSEYLPFIKHEKNRFIGGEKNNSKKIIAILVLALIISEFVIMIIPKGYVELNAIDVGQGDGFYIKTSNNKKILVDGGGSATYDVGENILVPYLLDKRVMCLDTLIISHSDDDHMLASLTMLDTIKVKNIILAKNSLGFDELYKKAKEKNIKIIEVLKGDEIIIDDVVFKIISPDKTMKNEDVNEYSLVVKMIYGKSTVLFTGDIGQDTEKKLYDLEADILKVGHHGSKNSSSEDFIHKVKPKISIISVAKNNKYGHPSEEVLKRLIKFSQIYTTKDLGEIKTRIYKDKVIVE